MSVGKGIETPVLLAAMPQVHDPFFHQSVVLLIHHDNDEGSFGLIVNRPTELLVADILEGMEIEWSGPPDSPAFFGGPVRPQLGTLLYRPGASEPQGLSAISHVGPGIATTQHITDLSLLASQPPAPLRLVLGYAGWAKEQLLQEILRNDWLTAPAHTDLVFTADPETAWQETLNSVGVDPTTLPSWTPDGDENAN
jgi:putative transcriptional regulator